MKRMAAAVLAFLVVACGGDIARAQGKYPAGPVRVIVPFGPGGAGDIIARVISEHLRKKFAQPFVVENKPGAFGILGIEDMVRARHDGYTVMVGNITTHTLTPLLHAKKFKINPERDVQPVTRLVQIPSFMLGTAQSFEPKTFAEMVAHVKANPGKVRYASAGIGSFPHFDMAVFAKRAGLDFVHVPNQQSAAGMLKDLSTGDSQVGFLNVATAAPLVRAGTLRAYAVATEQRLPDFPDVPTMAELGFPGVGTRQWIALFAPASAPDDALAALHAAVLEALADAGVQDTLKKSGMEAVPNASLAEAKAWLAAENATWRKITEEIKVDLE